MPLRIENRHPKGVILVDESMQRSVTCRLITTSLECDRHRDLAKASSFLFQRGLLQRFLRIIFQDIQRGELSVDALILAMKTTFDPLAAGDLNARIELRLNDDRFRAEVTDGRVTLARGPADRPDAAIEAGAGTFRAVLFGSRRLADAQRSGDLTVTGDLRVVTRFLAVFPRPAPG